MNFLRNQPEVGHYVVTSGFFFFCLFFLHLDLFHGLAGR